ncbi:MAG: hypothetical protein IPM46_04495 [Flavobacteriales bacterium]|nr:hypothetical protein [Flavobacteriales bacterium]
MTKNERLRAIGSPKVVLVGGSNLSYGVDSEHLEKAFCRPVANMGLTALVGFRFAVNEVVGELGAGDVVIVALENSMFMRPDRFEDALATVVDYRPASLTLIPWHQRPRMIVALGVLHVQSLRDHVLESWKQGWGAPVYRRRVFNAQGDLVNQLDEPGLAIAPPDPAEFDTLVVAEGFWPIADVLQREAQARGASVVFSWCPVAERVDQPEERAELRTAMLAHGLTVAGVPSDYVFPDSLFYDSWYHLHTEGRWLRTERMVNDVCVAFPGACCATE